MASLGEARFRGDEGVLGSPSPGLSEGPCLPPGHDALRFWQLYPEEGAVFRTHRALHACYEAEAVFVDPHSCLHACGATGYDYDEAF